MNINNTKLVFSNTAQAREQITKYDEYLSCLNEFNLRCRLNVENPTIQQYIEHLSKNVRRWHKKDKNRMIPLLELFAERTAPLNLNMPEEIQLVKVSNDVEYGAISTRGNAIFYSEAFLNCGDDDFARIIMHEFFHILTRNNPDLKEKLYYTIGYSECHDIDFPESISKSIIVNPDAPNLNYKIKVTYKGNEEWATPVVYVEDGQYDIHNPVPFFQLLKVKLVLLDPIDENGEHFTVKHAPNKQPILLEPSEVEGFFEQIGKNTTYIIHPEEVLAENFAHLMRGTKDLPNPEIPEQVRKIITTHFKPTT